jgi:hypothetical protein|tara:strand:- start:289 stop:606 length:318 start_codon:yes stop_codon:yes gene_type:complete
VRFTRQQLRRIISEIAPTNSYAAKWADLHGLETDVDDLGDTIIFIDDVFAQGTELPPGVDWDVRRAADDSGWVIYTGGPMEPEYEEISSGGLDDLDDIGIDTRGY